MIKSIYFFESILKLEVLGILFSLGLFVGLFICLLLINNKFN